MKRIRTARPPGWKIGGGVIAVLALSLITFCPAQSYAGSDHHGGGHHHGGHGLSLHLGHGGYGRYGGYGGHGYGYGYGYGGYGGHGYGSYYGYGGHDDYLYRDSYYRYRPSYSRYYGGGYYGRYPSYGYDNRSHARVYYGGSQGAVSGSYGTDYPQRQAYVTPSLTGDERGTGLDGRAWSLLADGRHGDALRRFASAASARPRAGVPKIGYALSAALAGDTDIGVWAMRRAVAADAGALHRVRESGLVQGAIDQTAGLYERADEQGRSHADTAFMLAALYDLQGEVRAARVKINQAVEAGDTSPSALAMKKMLDDDYPETPKEKAADGHTTDDY